MHFSLRQLSFEPDVGRRHAPLHDAVLTNRSSWRSTSLLSWLRAESPGLLAGDPARQYKCSVRHHTRQPSRWTMMILLDGGKDDC
ncbi:hypothetical protein BDZ89DRAFT_149181 [Hymenopellis radicata]|nr:hypothetical protein BDZ89DRAFT_149181 [Hymenopellis radicata]